MVNSLDKLNKNEVLDRLRELVRRERRLTTTIIQYVREVDRRRLYLEFGFPSLFAFLTKSLGYSEASAQRRIDTARMMNEVPEISQKLEAGELHLSQIAMTAQAIRQKQKTRPEQKISTQVKKDLLGALAHQDYLNSQQIVAKTLDLPIKQTERKSAQADGPIRLELTLTAEQKGRLDRLREVVSHAHPSATNADLFDLVILEYLKRKDPLRSRRSELKNLTTESATNKVLVKTVADDGRSVEFAERSEKTSSSDFRSEVKSTLKPLPEKLRQEILQRDQCCQWKSADNQQICESKFLLQVDHRHSRWAGGSNDPINLQALCAAHNQLKYCKEAGLS